MAGWQGSGLRCLHFGVEGAMGQVFFGGQIEGSFS